MCRSTTSSPAVQRDTRKPSPIIRPVEPSVRWADRPTADYPYGVVEVTAGREVAFYEVSELGVQFEGCRAFHFVKQGDPGHEYDVLIASNPQDHSCHCLGHLRHGRCRHVAAAQFVASAPAPEVPDTRPVPVNAPF